MPNIPTFNWESGSWKCPETQKSDASICITGDWAPIRAFQNIIESSPESVYGDLLPAIQASDLSIANLEAPLSDRGTPVCKSGAVFKGELKHVKGLAAASFGAVTLANNHVFDYGIEAFRDTLEILDKYNIRHTGAGMDEKEAAKPLLMDINGSKIGIVNFSEGEDLTAAKKGPGVMGWDLDTVKKEIRSLKKRDAFVIVISHCGIEYIPFPPPYVANAFKEIAKTGADLVIGHHPHVPQGISFQGGVPVCHSLGNFVFYQETELKFRKLGYMVKIGVKDQALNSFELLPYKIGDHGLSSLTQLESADFLKKLAQVSIPLDTQEGLEDSWNGFLDYYGPGGFSKEIHMIMEKMEQDLPKGAAMFRNRLTTLQHHNHLRDLLTRIIQNKTGSSPAWAKDLAREWLTTRI